MKKVASIVLVAVFVIGIVIGISGEILAAKRLLIADFDKGENITNIGSRLGAWDKDPSDDTQTCITSFSDRERVGKSGKGLKIDYDVDSPNPAYNGVWIQLNKLDVSSYKKLTFHVKGDLNGCTNIFKLEIKSSSEVGYYLVSGVSNDWKKISIPLEDFENISDFTELSEISVVFDDINATAKAGTMYIDNIAFE